MGWSASVTGGPPATAIFFKFPPAMNPTDRPSGDQNGNVAPSVPESLRASCEASDRTVQGARTGFASHKTPGRIRRHECDGAAVRRTG